MHLEDSAHEGIGGDGCGRGGLNANTHRTPLNVLYTRPRFWVHSTWPEV